MSWHHRRRIAAPLLVIALCSANFARAELSAEELAKLAQNPVGNLISVPFQNNTNQLIAAGSPTREMP